MKKNRAMGLTEDVRREISGDPAYAAEYFRELSRRPLPAQLALLRRLKGLTQAELAGEMGLKQTHVSRLEKPNSDHLLSAYLRAAQALGARLALVPAR
ncbi:MAG TPA: helix-turn-helix domain-containing protein [Elusimicrobiota bacterium]|nr:helix-turn-helix domain-containing protein [Elusimicrobiota bacterium]